MRTTKMLTKEIENVLEKYPIYSQDGLMGDAKVICYYFHPLIDATWIVTEGEKKEGGDWEFFGLVKIEEWEWGYFRLSDIKQASRALPIPIEREIYTKPLSRTVRQLATGCPEYLLLPAARSSRMGGAPPVQGSRSFSDLRFKPLTFFYF